MPEGTLRTDRAKLASARAHHVITSTSTHVTTSPRHHVTAAKLFDTERLLIAPASRRGQATDSGRHHIAPSPRRARQRADDRQVSVAQPLMGKFLDTRIFERATITATETGDSQASASRPFILFA
jgi:hypothetical protein